MTRTTTGRPCMAAVYFPGEVRAMRRLIEKGMSKPAPTSIRSALGRWIPKKPCAAVAAHGFEAEEHNQNVAA